MSLFKFLLKRCHGMILITGLIALFSGGCNAGLIALINTVMNHPTGATRALLLGFIALALGKILTGFISQIWLIQFSQKAIASIRQELVRKILAVPLRQLEEIGPPRLMVALADDINNITAALFGFPVLAVNIAILLGGSVYMIVLSWRVLLAMGVFIVFGACCYRLLIKSGFHFLHGAREAEERLFGHFRALTEGIKELKLHRERRGAFLNEGVQTATEDFQRHNIAAETRFILAHNWSHLLFFLLIGLILFLLPGWEPMSAKTMTGFVMTTLYLMGPLAGVMGSIALFGRANVALQKIDELGLSLSSRSADACAISSNKKLAAWECLELIGVTHSYHRESEGSNFILGPINLTFNRGELVYLGGGNGSGKSTLAKLITGLYPPESGEVRLDGKLINNQNRDDYRQFFSAVFSDYYLFADLMGLHNPRLDALAKDYLVQLQLNHKVKITNGHLSTTALSQGQRKRLALLTAYLENRSFYLFDEWASDQDPLFKEVFYTQLLPELKAQGKTALVITHDDKYFHLADRFLRLDYGKIEQKKIDSFKRMDPSLRSLAAV